MIRPWSTVTAALVLVVAATLVSACSSNTDPEPLPPLELTQAESGTTQEMQIGQELHIALDANPTTGYQWVVVGQMPAQIESVGAPRFTAASEAIGAGGTEEWTFAAKSAGEGTLELKYWRSFEPSASSAAQFRVVLRIN